MSGSATEAEGWIEYLIAARRKVEIARYHLAELEGALDAGSEEVRIQAHFEGVLFCFVAAADQLAEALNQRMGLGLTNPNLQQALEVAPKSRFVKGLFKWQQAPVAADVRDIRRRAMHHHYVKAPGRLKLEVQLPTSARPYGGSRDLVAYARAAVEHLSKLEALIGHIEEALGDR